MTSAKTDSSILEYLRAHRLGVLATSRKSGAPQQTLIAYNFNGADFVISTRTGNLKTTYMRRRPDVSLAVIDGRNQVIVYGKAQIIGDTDEVLAINLARLRNVGGRAGESDEEVAARLLREERVVIQITPESYFPLSITPTAAAR